ncbi:transposase, Tn3 family protein 2 [Herbaspirillum sp. GW103]|uniref:Tn3 family transposase n=1 Tax=Herbaspirillum sp. GW103 TaxID=1175306 RepID=UPI00025E26C9|nr:Tn3 family transposase [Herbaspirillum sp. GW103]EIJ47512.1 transposase, Tn3 family protein 2 [Herbaspirillum sp. GW103]
MASIERTAYPRFPRTLTLKDLHATFTPRPEEIEWVAGFARSAPRRLALLVNLKCFQFLRYFPAIDAIPAEIVEHISASLGMQPVHAISYPDSNISPYRHHKAIRTLLGVTPYEHVKTRPITVEISQRAAAIVDTRVDIINITVEELVRSGYELPAFSTLDTIAEKAHAAVESALYKKISQRLSSAQRQWLDSLLDTELPQRRSLYHQIKRSAKKASRKHLDLVLDQLNWLESLPDPGTLLEDVPANKLRHLSDRAAVLDAAEMKDYNPAKRQTLILALIHHMRIGARDDIAEMFIRRISAIHKSAREELQVLQARQRELSEELVATLEQVVEILAEGMEDAPTGRRIRDLLAPHGSLERLQGDCEAIRVWSGGNHLPLLWKPFKSWRAAMFQMAKVLVFHPATQDKALLKALDIVMENEHRKAEWIAEEVDLSFASERWHKLVRRSHGLGNPTNRRYLEVCVFSHLASDLRSGDVCIEGAGTFADYRGQLLSWKECEALLPEYCDRIGIAVNPQAFVENLKSMLADTAAQVDSEFPQHAGDVSIGANGEPTLRRVTAREIPASAIALQAAIDSRLVPRNLLDILANIEHWTGFTRNFGPQSGDDPKLRNARERYLLTVFAMGCNLGPHQAARHLSNGVTPHQLSYVNQRHMSLEQLDNACRDLAELYLRLELPKLWGDGTKVAADATHHNFYEQNLLVGMHFRYKRMGAVAYRHVADNYIANFRSFIPPGMLEAIYVIEGLMKAGLSVQPDTVYSDTHGQSEVVFAFTYLNGIQLMPRIRNWKDLKFYKADKATKYKHIDRLFSDVVDWKLIQNHWQDLMQVAISIQQGKVASPMLLRKLSHDGRHNRLFAAARELGRVLRTIYLLRWISQKEMRQEVTATTNKIESYHAFTKWLDFGGDVITENDLNEQQKRVRYIDLVASSVILQNTVDMMRIIQELYAEGEQIAVEDATYMSPYGTTGVKRFGNYFLDMKRPPEAWLKEALFKQAAKRARAEAPKGAEGGA